MGDILTKIAEVLVPLATILTTLYAIWKELKKSDYRTQIMFLILEDHDLVRDGKLPENRKDIEELFDAYTKAGGNSHIKRKVNEYNQWIEDLNKDKKED